MTIFRFFAQIAVLVLTFAYVIFLFRRRNHPENMRRCAVVIFLLGTVLYYIGYRHEPISEGIITTVARSALSSVKLFVFDNDLLEIEHVQEEPYFLDMFIAVYALALLTTVSAVVMLFGKRVMGYILLKFIRRKPFKYIFLGVNSNSVSIAEGLPIEDVAFIEFPEEKKGEFSLEDFAKNLLSGKHKKSLVSEDEFVILHSKKKLSSLNSKDGVFSQIGLSGLYGHLSPETQFFVCSNDTDQNLKDVLVLVGDEKIRGHVIHVGVKRQGLSQAYRELLKKDGVHFIYPSSMSMVEIMKNVRIQPADTMEVLKDSEGRGTGTVTGEFGALIVGFGETGQAALKMVYEMSSAIAPDGNEMPCRIYVQDRDMDMLKGRFLTTCPSLMDEGRIIYENAHSDSNIFWDNLHSRIDSLNYIVIAVGDDDKNLDIASLIVSYALKTRKKGVDDFKILVRKTRTNGSQRMLKESLNARAGREVVCFYGEYDSIFTSDMVVSKASHGINQLAVGSAEYFQKAFAAIAEAEGFSMDDSPFAAGHTSSGPSRMNLHLFVGCSNHSGAKKMFSSGWTPDNIPADVLESLAKNEHVRVCRYLRAHGYCYAPVDNEKIRHTRALVEWDELDGRYKQFYRLMARASLS